MTLTPVHHLAIQVDEINKAVSWYTSRFNCEILYQDPTWAVLRFANIDLALVLSHEHPAHIAFVDSDIVRFGPATTHRDGTCSVYIEDSAGNVIEILDAQSTDILKR